MDFSEIFNLANILSLVFYLSVFSAAALLAHLSIVKKKKSLAVAAVVLPTFLAAFRYKVGLDYQMYVDRLPYLAQYSIGDYLSTSYLYSTFEPLFYLAGHLPFSAGWDAIVFFALTSGATAGLYFLASKKYSPNHAGLLYFLMLMTVFSSNLNAVRQGVAVAAGFYAVTLIIEKRFWRFAAVVGLASLLHYTAIIMLAAYPLYWLFYKKWPLIKDSQYVTKIAGLTGGAMLGSSILIKDIDKIPFFSYYSYILSPDKLAMTTSPNIISKIVPVLLVLPYYSRLVKKDRNNAFYMLMSVIAIFFTGLGFFAGYVYRLGNYFIPFYAILFVNSIDVQADKAAQKRIISFIIIYAIAHFVGSNMIRNSYGIFPYNFVF